MSRLPQPSSSTNSRTRLTSTPTVPSSSLRAPVTPLARPRAKTPSSTAPSSPVVGAKPRAKTPSAAPSPGLRSQPSLKSLRVNSPIKSPARKTQPLPDEDVPPVPKPQLSIREQIALKRAEVKKVVKTSPVRADFGGLEDASPLAFKQPVQQDVDLGRWSIKETIERGRSSDDGHERSARYLASSPNSWTFIQGTINLSSRDLPCLPSALFEIHLGITPEPLKSVPNEPPITTSTSVEIGATRRKGNADAPSWYDAQDLEILKAWSNEIVELQPELSMFGSLKVIDFHNNKLSSLPDSFADLTALTSVDLSHNALSSLPVNFWALPHLTSLNLSHNQLASLPFSSAFGHGSTPLGRTKDSRGDWFSRSITRATEPLPRLTSLDVSHNPLSAASIDQSGLPTLLSKLDLSGNPLGKCDTLFQALGRLQRLREVHMVKADVGDDSFPVSIFSSASGSLFPSLKILDMEETQVSRPAIEAVFTPNAVKQTVEYDSTTQEPPGGTLRIIVGKRVIKEAWEIEAERRTKQRRLAALADNIDSTASSGSKTSGSKTEVLKEAWEIEAEQGLLSAGAKRRALAAAATASQATSSQAKERPPPLSSQPRKKVVEKEAWEIEAEQGLLSAGGRRRARAAALAASSDPAKPADISRAPSPSSTARAHTPPTVGAALANPQFYDAAARTLTLPPSAPPSKANHARSFSLAAPAWSKGGTGTSTAAISELALALPAQTLPLAAIAPQPLAHTLKVLVLTNRRADPSFSVPLALAPCLPVLEELVLENCNLTDTVPVAHVGEGAEEYTAPRANEPLLPLLARLFPSVRNLNLSYNNLTSAALTHDALTALIFADEPGPGQDREHEQGEETGGTRRKGLRQLHLRGNRLVELDGFQQLAERFRGNRAVPEWKLEELDLRDNEIGRLPAELGLLPLDVFLVDGNTFRVPARRVWEREGTKGLLSWLRGRIE